MGSFGGGLNIIRLSKKRKKKNPSIIKLKYISDRDGIKERGIWIGMYLTMNNEKKCFHLGSENDEDTRHVIT